MIRKHNLVLSAGVSMISVMTTSSGSFDDGFADGSVRNVIETLTSASTVCSSPAAASEFVLAGLSDQTGRSLLLLGAVQTASGGPAIASADASNTASAESAPNPPAGWENPPPKTTTTSTKKKTNSAACCAFDRTCCSRQTDIDNGVRPPTRRTFAVPFSKIPEPTVKVAAKDGPPIEGFADLQVVDGTGAPFPWPNGPQRFEVRLIPNARFGFLKFGNHWEPHYGDPNLRSLSYGLTIPINPTPDKGRSLLKGPFEYTLYNPGKADEVIYDYVAGRLDGSPKIIADRWEHLEAPNVAEGIVHVYRGTYKDKPHVFFLLPEVMIGFESKEASTFGGTGNDRFATDFPYTLYRFPLSNMHSNTVNCILREYEVRRWFPRPKDAMKLPEDMPIVISMSQTSVEAEPQIRIMFL